MRLILEFAVTIYLASTALTALATVIGDHICTPNIMCGSGSKACTGWGGACTFCNGATVVDMCVLSIGATCPETGNLACGSTFKGTCDFGGHCQGTTLISGNCQVLGC